MPGDTSDGTDESLKTVNIVPSITFDPDKEWVCDATFILGLDEGDPAATPVGAGLRGNPLVDDYEAVPLAERFDDARSKVRDLRKLSGVVRTEVEFVTDIEEYPVKVVIEGAYPTTDRGMAPLLFSAHMKGTLGDIDGVGTVCLESHSAYRQRDRTIEELMSVTFEDTKFAETEDGGTVKKNLSSEGGE